MDVTTVGTVSEDEGTFVHFKDVAGELLYDTENGEQTPVGAVVSGTYSKHYKAAQRKVKDRNLRTFRRNEDFNPDALDLNDLELQVACIRSWTFTANGAAFPVTVDNWRAIVEKQPQWQEQVERAMGDHARFLGKSSAA